MAQQKPITTIPPFTDTAQLPACATSCGPLHDANGACVPPAAATADASVYDNCFCNQKTLAPFKTATNGVCDDVCDSGGLGSIANWYRKLCSVTDGGDGQATSTATDSTGNKGSSGSGNKVVHKDWISGHWQWVIMIVILILAIVGIWVGACIWRRRYIKKKDRQSTLGQKQSGSASHPSWGPGFPDPNADPNASTMSAPNLSPTPQSDDPRTKGAFMPGAVASALGLSSKGEDGKKKKWVVKERT